MLIHYATRSLYIGKGINHSTEVLYVCEVCGAAMFSNATDKHTKFHEGLEQKVVP